MQVVTVRMDEELVRRLKEIAKLQGVTRSALIKEILGEALDRSASPLREAVLALHQGKKPGKKIDWSKIKKELQQTKPYLSTVEEAIAYSRKRA